MNFDVRDLHPADFDDLWQIDQQCFTPGIAYSRDELNAYIRAAGAFTLIAEKADPAASILGFIVGHGHRRQVGHIVTIDVIAEARGQGVGSRLLSAVENRLRAEACHRIRLEVAVDNLPAIAFYKRHGYAVEKTIAEYYSNGVDAFRMTKAL